MFVVEVTRWNTDRSHGRVRYMTGECGLILGSRNATQYDSEAQAWMNALRLVALRRDVSYDDVRVQEMTEHDGELYSAHGVPGGEGVY